jgi:hypothetical protein
VTERIKEADRVQRERSTRGIQLISRVYKSTRNPEERAHKGGGEGEEGGEEEEEGGDGMEKRPVK